MEQFFWPVVVFFVVLFLQVIVYYVWLRRVLFDRSRQKSIRLGLVKYPEIDVLVEKLPIVCAWWVSIKHQSQLAILKDVCVKANLAYDRSLAKRAFEELPEVLQAWLYFRYYHC